MSDPGESHSRPPTDHYSSTCSDPIVPLTNLSAVSSRMESLQHFLTNAINRNTVIDKQQMDMVSSELTSAIHQVIVNGAALIACSSSSTSQVPNSPPPQDPQGIKTSSQNRKVGSSDLQADRRAHTDPKLEVLDEEMDEDELKKLEDDYDDDYDVVEIDAVELLAEHIHICEICGKGFKRDANLRMHMRAHGEEYKKPEALAKPAPEKSSISAAAGTTSIAPASGGTVIGRKTRFSCPYAGCNRNQNHSRFRPLKSVTCVKNHFKRSHCPKMYRCNRCNKKSFSVMTDLKSHLKHCGEAKWKCSCGNTFSRKDKLFGHMALFEGHMPAIEGTNVDIAGDQSKATVIEVEEDDSATGVVAGIGSSSNSGCGFFEGMIHEGFDGFSVQDWLDPPCNSPEMKSAMDQLYRNS